MADFFGGDVTTIAFLWRLERRDGVVLGFTSHDRDLMRNGLRYRATPGMVPSAIERNDQLDVANVSLAGALTSDAITADDLASGRWDGAALWLWMADWLDATQPPLLLVRGELGTIDMTDRGFSAELRGATALFEAPVVAQTSPDCRAQFGDKLCRIPLAGRTHIARAVTLVGPLLSLDQAFADALFNLGQLRWLDGPNAGLRAAIATSTGATVLLQEQPAAPVAPGTRVMLLEGCDKRFTTCCARFNNAINFRGEPHIPGTDLLLRYGT